MHSFPTPEHVVRVEQLRPGFAKIFLEETARPLHLLTEADTGLAHDHPHDMTTHILLAGYIEEVIIPMPGGRWRSEVHERLPGTSHKIKAGTIHRILRLLGPVCLTHIEPGPPANRWGFFDPRPDGSLWHRYPEQQEWQRWPREEA